MTFIWWLCSNTMVCACEWENIRYACCVFRELIVYWILNFNKWTWMWKWNFFFSRCFGFVARKPASKTDNQCHIFAELEPEQPASAIVNFVSKVMMSGASAKANIVWCGAHNRCILLCCRTSKYGRFENIKMLNQWYVPLFQIKCSVL